MPPSNLAALRGEPSYVWREGQERRLKLVEKWAKLDQAEILIDGCGVGMYASQIRRRYTDFVHGFDIEQDRVAIAQEDVPTVVVAAAEQIPYPANAFDTVLSHEVLEHVQNDRAAIGEMVRVLKPGGRVIIFLPNRWYPFETHGHYWRGTYHFGNTPLINYLPNVLRDRLAPHVRAYTRRTLLSLFDELPVTLVHHERIFGGYDNIIARLGQPARIIRNMLYHLEGTPLDFWALSHLLVMEKRS